MLNRAYTLFQVKGIDPEQRLIEGYASTPTLDRQGDVLLSRGAEFTLPMPLLWQHQHDKPIGQVLEAKVDDRGIRIKAQIARGVLPFIDEAWALIKSGLVRGFSVGWKPLEQPTRRKDGGFEFARWMWAETSAVTIPANATASIDLIKSLDASPAVVGIRPSSPAVVGTSPKVQTMTPNPQPIAAQIDATMASLNTKSARLQELMLRDGADGSLEASEATERDTLTGEVETLSARLKGYRAIEMAQAAAARPVIANIPQVSTQTVTQPPYQAQVEVKSTLPPGIEFSRYLIVRMAAARAASNGLFVNPIDLAKKHYPDNPRIQWMLKEEVPAATTTDNLWASPLVQVNTVAGEFVEYLRPQTVIGRISGMTRVPFNSRVAGQTSGGTGYWVGQGKAKPLTKFNLNATSLTFTKVAAIIALTEELARFSSPSAEERVRNELVNALRERIDVDFLDPTKAAVAGVSPASITNGITNLNDTGATLANTKTDIQQFFNAMIGNNIPLSQCVWIMPESVAMQLSLMSDSNGVLAFPGVTVTGGTFMSLPVITSQHLVFSHTPANNKVILLHPPSIALADDGGFTVDVSREASLEMEDAPVMSSGGSTGSPVGPVTSGVVSMFQTDSIAIRGERYINWARLRNAGVVWMDDVRWAA